MAVIFQRLENQGEAYKDELITYNEAVVANIPQVEMAEIQQPSPERRIMSITLKPRNTVNVNLYFRMNRLVLYVLTTGK